MLGVWVCVCVRACVGVCVCASDICVVPTSFSDSFDLSPTLFSLHSCVLHRSFSFSKYILHALLVMPAGTSSICFLCLSMLSSLPFSFVTSSYSNLNIRHASSSGRRYSLSKVDGTREKGNEQ